MIAASAEARLIVDAGPGTGKTATAAGRIATLAEKGIPPAHIWTISFSRAAVAEMRARLLSLGGGQTAPGHVTTLDSLAWYLRAGGEDDGMVLEGHDQAIEETLTALRARDPVIRQRLAAMRHFTIDEAQDLVGIRALLVVELLAALPRPCGVTILTDEAQAIYGFSASALTASFSADTVARHLLDQEGTPYRLMQLTEIHRTGDPRLLSLFQSARSKAMQQVPNPAAKLKRMRRGLAWRAHGRPVSNADADSLILYRTRAEVLAAAQTRIEKRQPFRLRLSGLPVMLHPWIAEMLGDFKSGILARWQFEDLWAARIGGDPLPSWQVLAQAIGEPTARTIAVPRLMAILSTSHPPSELCLFDPGDAAGPVLGTIHASKGREMAHVQLMLPQGRTGHDDPDAEARVLFVGATRARRRLEVGKGPVLGAKQLANGRVFIPSGLQSVRVEMGRPGDFILAVNPDLSDLSPGQGLAMAIEDGTLSLSYKDRKLGQASPGLMADLRDIRGRLASIVDYRPVTAKARGLAFLGAYTLPGEALCLAPAVSGLADVNFGP